MRKFIGGNSIPSLLDTVTSLNNKRILPIIDYAREGSRNSSDVINYLANIDKLILALSENKLQTALAFKLSSFLPYQPYKNISLLIDKVTSNIPSCNTIFLDAEDTSMKSKEDYIYNKIVEAHQNTPNLTIYKTYQMYRVNSLKEVEDDLKRFDRVGLKIVRGAYHSNYDFELLQSKKETDDNYNEAIKLIAYHKYKTNVCYATHNPISIDLALSTPSIHNISFAQLLGMRDDITDSLVNKGKKVYKYVPYGSYREMLPYLVRRLYENKSILQWV